jgi:hypothetical protein
MSRIVNYQQGAYQIGRVRSLPLVPVTSRVVYSGLRLNGGSPAVGYGGWWQNLIHPRRAQSSTQSTTQDQEYAAAAAQMAQAEAESRSRFLWAAGAGAALLAAGGAFYAWRKKRRKNGRRRNR